MSRGVRDLRELICVSRLTIRDSDEELFSDEDNVRRDFDTLSLSSTSSVDSQKAVATPTGHTSPDSGCQTNGSTPPEPVQNVDARPKSSTKAKKRKKKEKKKPVLDLIPNRHELPKPEILPPLAVSSSSSACMTEHEVDSVSRPVLNPSVPPHDGNFDNMLCYMDATVVSNWLGRANENVVHITSFCRNCENFVRFAHFWLSDFPDQQKNEIFELEMGILSEEVSFAFAVGKDQRKVNQRDIHRLIGAIFREYPAKILSMKGPHMFLDYLDVLSSDKKSSYKKLLSDVKCSTRNKQYAQWLLATRSFAIVSIWSSVLNFYKNLLVKNDSSELCLSSNEGTVHHQRLTQAIRLGFVDVLHYYLSSNLISPYFKDSHNRTYLFTAVMHNQPSVLHYLINRIKPPIDINCASDTGNTPLHAAANNGNVELVTMLLQNPRINLNCKNPQCDNATPLHLAVMMGNKEVVEKLVKLGADTKLKMGELDIEEIARDFGHSDLLPSLSRK
ncbi:hypothetical protein FSP39_017513 [Pinctada imbricata]|uniref:SIPAR domain-containing protein n=1 Tax=Pinctada imbricata TaxID=66713 RepID=A0AA88XT26_PINIB|nr:hypothetical protein FSP39_017513 [Pinctada imbricata]